MHLGWLNDLATDLRYAQRTPPPQPRFPADRGDFARNLPRLGIFSDTVAFSSDGFSFTYDGRAERIQAEVVSPNFFPFLGLEPFLGQGFTRGVQAGRWAAETVLSYRFWMRRFGGDPHVIGKAIRINTYPFTIVGVSSPASTTWTKGTIRTFGCR